MPEKRLFHQPYNFTEHDLSPEKFTAGANHTLERFYAWRDDNPQAIAEHVTSYTDYLATASKEYGTAAILKRRLIPGHKEAFEKEGLTRDIGFFGVYNLGEMPSDDTIEAFSHHISSQPLNLDDLLKKHKKNQPAHIVDIIGQQVPVLKEQPELLWLEEQLKRLQNLLPEEVIKNGGMGKTARTIAGVLAIGLYDTLGESSATQKEHLARILPAAYGATYPIIDDTLQDSDYVPKKDKARYHRTIAKGLRTGGDISPKSLPDHPLAEELVRLYDTPLDSFPFDEYRHLYHAGESMYLAQDRDAKLTPENVALRGLASLYPDVFIKSSLSRVVANIIGRRKLDDDYYRQAVNINFTNQLRDDLHDRHEDTQAGRVTPFTYGPADDISPFSDLVSYSAYLAEQLFSNDPAAAQTLAHFNARKLGFYLSKNPEYSQLLINNPDTTDEMAKFIRTSSDLPSRVSTTLQPADLQLQDAIASMSKDRQQTDVDPRTFISDRIEYINQVVLGEGSGEETVNDLNEITTYALEAGGKRLRPALALMLAESLGVKYRNIEPILRSIELFHTSSLIFDDMPAQDDAVLRRGKPTAHVAFGEARAQLAGIAMMSNGFGGLSELSKFYPAERVTAVLHYYGTVLGPERLCRGQDIDLRMASDTENITTNDIIEMYNLKTSTSIEASLIPIMILEERPPTEIELMKKYAYHAGIVFQIQDDILDMTETSTSTGKDANNDIGKANIARREGIEKAQLLMHEHLQNAIGCCQNLPFNTNLLEGIAKRFAARRT